MHQRSFKLILFQVLVIVLMILTAALIWNLPYEARPHISKLLFCLAGAGFISRGSLSAAEPVKQLLQLYTDEPYDSTPSGAHQANVLIAKLYRAFAIVGVGAVLLHVAMSGRGV